MPCAKPGDHDLSLIHIFVEDHVAHGLLLHVVVEIFVNQRRLLDQLLFRETGGELGLQRICFSLLAIINSDLERTCSPLSE